MLLVPHIENIRHQHNLGTVGVVSLGSTVTTGTPSTTKGSIVELLASLDFDAHWVVISAAEYNLAGSASTGCLDIMIGAASSEEVLIPNLLFGGAGGGAGGAVGKRWEFPLYIPAGSRLSAQAAGSLTSTAFRVLISVYGCDGLPPFPTGTKVVTYGVTVPDGTVVTPGASGAEGSWVEIVASTSEDHVALIPSFQVNDATMNNRNIFVDLGFGAATEEEVGQSYIYTTNSGEIVFGPAHTFPTFVQLPSGTRLVMRASNSGTNDSANQGAIHAVS